MSELIKSLKKYLQVGKKKWQLQKIQREYCDKIQNIIKTEKEISVSEFKKIRQFLIQNGGNIPYIIRDWYLEMKQKLSKGIKYKGYEIKSGQYHGYLHIYKDGEIVDGIHGEMNEKGILEAKKYIQLIIKTQKNAPLLMKKLGIQNLQYTILSCKRITVYDKQVRKIKEDKDFQRRLVKFAQETSLPIKKWKVQIEHNVKSLSDSDIRYEQRTQNQFNYAQGDVLKISVEDLRYTLQWGV